MRKSEIIPKINEIEPSFFISLDQVLDGFLSTKRSQNTKRAYARDISDLLSFLEIENTEQLAAIAFHELVVDIQSHLEECTEIDDLTGRPLNPTTINRKAYAFSSFFKYLIHSYGYPKNPLDQYQAHKVDRKSKTKSLTRAEILDVISFMAEKRYMSQTAYRDYLAICFLSVLALRRNELVGLKWSDIDFNASSANVFQKGGSYKLLPVPENLLKLISEYRIKYTKTSEYLFSPVRNNSTKTLNKPLNSSYIYQLVKKVVSKVAGGKKATPHSFRKSFIEMALNNQEDFISIINATGHATVEMVKYYDTRDTLKNNAVHGMSKLI